MEARLVDGRYWCVLPAGYRAPDVLEIRKGLWGAPIDDHDALCESLPSIAPLPKKLVALLRAVPSAIDEVKLETLPVYHKLRPSQEKAVRFMLGRGGRALNLSEMGTGKTITAICVSDYYRSESPQLVVCPSSLRHNWRSEYDAFSEQKATIFKKDFSNDGVNIVSYGTLCSKKTRALLSNGTVRRFRVVIMDESHYVKTRTSQRCKLLYQIAKRADRVILLSGTPSSRSVDLYAQLRMVEPKTFSQFFPYMGARPKKGEFYFASRYCKPKKVYLGYNRSSFTFRGNERSRELHAVLSKVSIRNTKEDLKSELPPKTRHKVIIESLSKRKRDELRDRMSIVRAAKKEEGSLKAQAETMELVRETARAKEKAVVRYLRDVVDRDDGLRYLLFAHHKFMISAMVKVLEGAKASFVVIDGATRPDARQKRVDEFQRDESPVRFAVLSIMAAGVGLNLYKANVVLFAELLFSEKDMLQAESRCHRIGCDNPVDVQYLVVDGSTDDFVWRILSAKVRTMARVVDNKKRSLDFSVVDLEQPGEREPKRRQITAVSRQITAGSSTRGRSEVGKDSEETKRGTPSVLAS